MHFTGHIFALHTVVMDVFKDKYILALVLERHNRATLLHQITNKNGYI